MLLAGSKVPSAADQTATPWAGILLGLCCFAWVLPSVADKHMHYNSVECDQHWSTHTEQGNYIVECRLVCYLASIWIGAVGSQQHSGSVVGQETLPAAQTRSALQTKRPPLGLESCWGSAVSHGLPSADTSMPLAGSKVPKRDRRCRPNGHPFGLNPAGAVLFRMCLQPQFATVPLAVSKVFQRLGLCCFAWVAQRQS